MIAGVFQSIDVIKMALQIIQTIGLCNLIIGAFGSVEFLDLAYGVFKGFQEMWPSEDTISSLTSCRQHMIMLTIVLTKRRFFPSFPPIEYLHLTYDEVCPAVQYFIVFCVILHHLRLFIGWYTRIVSMVDALRALMAEQNDVNNNIVEQPQVVPVEDECEQGRFSLCPSPDVVPQGDDDPIDKMEKGSLLEMEQ